MKNLFGLFAAVAIIASSFTSCNKSDDFDYVGEFTKQEKSIDSLLSSQKTKIEEYVDTHFGTNAIEDTTKYRFQYLNKTVKRGIWYEIINPATDNSYEYKLNSAQTGVVYPTWKLKYKVNLLTSETPVFSDLEGSNYTLSGSNANSLFTEAWVISLFPAKYKVNGQDINYIGLTKDGIKKGSKIRVIVPSIYAYGAQGLSSKNIPANSPLVYEFEVLEIQ
ncbi:MAG: FKBP-type peptidyl-prolyl cis-trans isomerase [Sphingobacterium composti]|uniref:FKBP-type peptidyl-prolyl cis-trans isomerase n=1 Tax=Sphingobacterium composti TaxID=363260 RepID=UPI00135835FE|nr:FKBP-type peptidyl-prolyl cis-trans isomerase [Sphingobacterium composti Ten et al. 2007 non Yoo et al. 2007]